jgi:hypothetical protein
MMEKFTLNSTKAYHVNQLKTLGWELTVCNALYPEGTPLRKLLSRNESFGNLLYDYLSKYMPMEKITRILEVGGGYGYLMKDFLDRNGSLKTCMIDISPVLLGKQQETLKKYALDFRQEDFLETDPIFLKGFDLAILNENLGDFPSLVNLSQDVFGLSTDNVDPFLQWAAGFFKKYNLERPRDDTFNVNVGAIEALVKLCSSGIPYIYLGEHSCEASIPEGLRSLIRIESTGNPERISLAGHDEYTIKFSHLEKVAASHGYKSIRGPFADFIQFEMTDEIRFILSSGGRHSDEAEMICQLVEDLYKYEYLILIKKGMIR